MGFSSRSLLSALFLVAVSPLAIGAGPQGNNGAPSIDYRAMQIKAARDAATAGQAGEYIVNSYRAYPPSCLNAPIPFSLYVNDPAAASKTVTLLGDPLSNDPNERAYTENVKVTLFRVPCGATSALLLELDRPANASAQYYPIFPGVAFSPTGYVPRVASDPNTWFSQVYANDPLFESTVVVFENYSTTQILNFNQALSVAVDNLSGNAPTTFTIPAYNPSAYAANALPLPISGYQSGNFYDPTHSGEGIQVEVGDVSTAQHFLTIAWYTFDDLGLPYWLIGSSSFPIGATKVGPFPMYFGSNGGFAGNFGAAATFAAWGTITVSFPDCNTMQFSYASNAGLPAGVPTGSGAKTWKRTTQLNGLTCQ
jgi:hypothetical protein